MRALAILAALAAACSGATRLELDGGAPDGAPDGGLGPADHVGPGGCSSAPELCCDRFDNDCDGEVDEGCDCDPECVCLPGAVRWCDGLYCRVGLQTCRDDGQGWEDCLEATSGPPECFPLDRDYSPAFFYCLLENGHCGQDLYDYDHDGDEYDSVGACDDVTCE